MRLHICAALLAASSGATAGGDPECKTGIPQHSPARTGDACCSAECGACGGPNCSKLPGGVSACCASHVIASGRSCETSGPPCVVGPPAPPPPPGPPSSATVSVAVATAVHTVASEYVSYTIDSSFWRSSSLNLADPTLRLLASALSPAHLRIGGTQEDYDVYSVGNASGASCEHLPSPMTDYRCKTVSETQFGGLLDFCSATGATLVYGLNDMYGRPTKTKPEKKLCTQSQCPARNQSNLEALLRWTAAAHSGAPLYAWELGNELNSCLDGDAGAEVQAADFVALSKLVGSIWPGAARPKLLGPDTHSAAEFQDSGRRWLQKFAGAAQGAVDGLTFHMYSLGNGPSLDPKNLDASYLSPSALDKSGEGGRTVVGIANKEGGGMQVWAGETAAANNGGQSGVTDTYIDGFWYLDQLGSLAAAGVSVFLRQTLVAGGGYPLVEVQSGKYTPLPDYWIALLYSKLMGRQVLAATSSSKTVRAYAHCGRNGGVALALLNLAAAPAAVTLGGLSGRREDYVLQAGARIAGAPNPLQSKQVLLNGAPLELQSGPSLPALVGKSGSGSTLQLPPTSYAFVSYPDAAAAACK